MGRKRLYCHEAYLWQKKTRYFLIDKFYGILEDRKVIINKISHMTGEIVYVFFFK